jgi:ATP-dependent exoDNAse (exonuclease V) beta subunit
VVDAAKARWDGAGFTEDPFGPTLRSVTVWRAAEARLLASRIDTLVRGGEFRFGDVAVLMRAATDMPYYERALTERGMPTYAAGARGYFSQQQIGDLRAYLAALANPLDGVALYGLLASPLVGVSLDGLTLIRLHSRGASRDPWWELVEAFCGSDPTGLGVALPDADALALRSFVPRFAEERRAAVRLSLETVIDRAVSGSGYDRAVLAMPSGERRMANVRKLMRLARDFEAREGRDLRRFIDYVDEQELIAAREGEAPLETESIDAVRLMTIHGAKGLEFPVVCVADMGRAGREDDTPLQVSSDGRVGLQLLSLAGKGPAALDQEELKKEEEARTEAEERRVFYVAMTRAEKHLVLSGATDVEKWPEAKPLGRPMDWVLPALVAAGVAPVICSPETVDDVLPAADRAPAAAATGAGDGVSPVAPEFPAVQAPVSLPLARLSYSSLEQYARCGYRFYLERVARLRDGAAAPVGELLPVAGDDEVGVQPVRAVWDDPPAEGGDQGQLGLPLAAAEAAVAPAAGDLDARLRGTIAHELLEAIDFDRVVAPSDADVAARIQGYGQRSRPEDVADLRRLVDAFLGSELCARVRGAASVRKELPFAFPLAPHGAGESILVNGVLDLYSVEADRALVVDYKSDRLAGADPVAFCAEHYATQRLVYALAALKSGARQVDVVHAFLELPGSPVVATFTSDDADALEARLVELADGVIAGRFEPTDDPHRDLCLTCPGRPALCCWDESRTLAVRRG